jgi:signal transduction histidine kinase
MTRRRPLRIVHIGEGQAPADAVARVAPDAGALLDNPALDATLERGLRAIVALTGARAGAIRLVSRERRGMRLVSATGLSPGAVDGEGGCGPVLAVPLHCGGEPIGVFNLFFGDSSRVPTDVRELIEPVARMLDVILENAGLEDARMRASVAAERQMLAGEVHDSLAQGLAYMRMRMPLLHDAIRTGERQHALKYCQDVNDAMGEAHGRLRELITQFRHVVDQGAGCRRSRAPRAPSRTARASSSPSTTAPTARGCRPSRRRRSTRSCRRRSPTWSSMPGPATRALCSSAPRAR